LNTVRKIASVAVRNAFSLELQQELNGRTAMGLFDDFSIFLDQRLDELLTSHPELQLQVLDDTLQDQAQDTQRLITELQSQQKHQEAEILATAQEIQRWHGRTAKAEAAGRPDLAQAAREREAVLLCQGNQHWQEMQSLKERLKQTQELLQKIQVRRQEVQAKLKQPQPSPKATTSSRANNGSYGDPDLLEQKFRHWETELELEALKREIGG
jgi:uncharacterized protein (TIGR04376 family)